MTLTIILKFSNAALNVRKNKWTNAFSSCRHHKMLHLQPIHIDSWIFAHIYQGCTRNASESLMDACNCRIGTSLKGWNREIISSLVTEIKMCTMRFIDYKDPFPADLLHCFSVKAEPIIGRISEVHYIYLWKLLEYFLNLACLDRENHVIFLIVFRLHVIYSCASHLQSNMQRYVWVALYQHILSGKTVTHDLIALSGAIL